MKLMARTGELIIPLLLLCVTLSYSKSLVKYELTCPKNKHDLVDITLTSSFRDVVATATCSDGSITNFRKVNLAIHSLKAALVSTGNESTCMFEKDENNGVYNMLIEVYFADVLDIDSARMLVCVYEPTAQFTTSQMVAIDGYGRFKQIRKIVGKPLSGISLQLVNMNNIIISPHETLVIGEKVRLSATINTPEYQGLTAWHCSAMTLNTQENIHFATSHSILEAGCGEGSVFDITRGFISQGRVTYSPYFEVFRFRGSSLLKFSCNFTACENACNGPSCQMNDRLSKRSVTENFQKPATFSRKHISLETATYPVSEDSQPVLRESVRVPKVVAKVTKN